VTVWEGEQTTICDAAMAAAERVRIDTPNEWE
jgi:hypothetical protein